jgi:enediyne biosynthesis protein E4
MVYANFWEDSDYIKNQGSGNSFLGLHLLLPAVGGAAAPATTTAHDGHPAWREGTPAIGAFVEIQLPDGRKLIRQVDGGNGHSGQRSPEVLFGLGRVAAATALPTRIMWRDFGGTLHQDTLKLAPGYHTVLLAASQGGNQ